MKKLFLSLAVLLAFTLSAQAQTTSKTKTVKKTAVESSAGAKKTATSVTKDQKVIKNGVVLKKDGTPDKRYKKTAVHIKKDGTPDRRYKENKKK